MIVQSCIYMDAGRVDAGFQEHVVSPLFPHRKRISDGGLCAAARATEDGRIDADDGRGA